jgi:hypothetical protein
MYMKKRLKLTKDPILHFLMPSTSLHTAYLAHSAFGDSNNVYQCQGYNTPTNLVLRYIKMMTSF